MLWSALQTSSSAWRVWCGLSARHLPERAKTIALAASLRPLDTVFEGDPADVGDRHQGTWRIARGAAAVMNPTTAVSIHTLRDFSGDVVAEMAAELLDGMRQAQR